MKKKDIGSIKKLKIENGDVVVVESSCVDSKTAQDIGNLLGCSVIMVENLNGIGILKTSKFKKYV